MNRERMILAELRKANELKHREIAALERIAAQANRYSEHREFHTDQVQSIDKNPNG